MTFEKYFELFLKDYDDGIISIWDILSTRDNSTNIDFNTNTEILLYNLKKEKAKIEYEKIHAASIKEEELISRKKIKELMDSIINLRRL